MRYFLAVDLPDEIKEEISRIKIKGCIYKPVKKENLHITLRFLGECNKPEVIKKIKKIRLIPTEAELGNTGAFPSWRLPRVLWVGVNNFESFYRGFSEVFGYEKNFVAHITIGRIKKITNLEALLELRKHKIKHLKFTLNNIKLKQSELTPQGPVYKDVYGIIYT